MYTIVEMINVSGYSLVIRGRRPYSYMYMNSEKPEQFIRERHGVANHVNTSPNSLGRLDNHKINFVHRQLHPSMIGVVDLLDYSKDVGQSGMISPWADISTISDVDINKYPNIKFELFKFIQEEFPNPVIRFNCNSIEEYNRTLDKLVHFAYLSMDYHVDGKHDDASS